MTGPLTPILLMTHSATAMSRATPDLLNARDSSKMMPRYPNANTMAIVRFCSAAAAAAANQEQSVLATHSQETSRRSVELGSVLALLHLLLVAGAEPELAVPALVLTRAEPELAVPELAFART